MIIAQLLAPLNRRLSRFSVAAGFTLAVLAGTPVSATDAKAAATIDRVDADWLDALKARDAERLAAAYAPDAVFVLSNGEMIHGRAAISDFYRARIARISKVLAGGIHRDGLAEGADGLVYEWGHGGSTTLDLSGKPSTSDGPYLTVWRRGSDGAWRIVRNLVF